MHIRFEGRHSRVYDFVARRLTRGRYRRIAVDVAAAAPTGGAVLDVGTGPGVLLLELAGLRPDLHLAGVDLSAGMVAAATRNLAPLGTQAEVKAGSATELPFPAASFDLVVSSFSLHHWDDPGSAAPELARVLRPGGRVVIYDFRFAPFAALAPSAAFPGAPRRTPFRGFPPCVRYELTA